MTGAWKRKVLLPQSHPQSALNRAGGADHVNQGLVGTVGHWYSWRIHSSKPLPLGYLFLQTIKSVEGLKGLPRCDQKSLLVVFQVLWGLQVMGLTWNLWMLILQIWMVHCTEGTNPEMAISKGWIMGAESWIVATHYIHPLEFWAVRGQERKHTALPEHWSPFPTGHNSKHHVKKGSGPKPMLVFGKTMEGNRAPSLPRRTTQFNRARQSVFTYSTYETFQKSYKEENTVHLSHIWGICSGGGGSSWNSARLDV